MSLNTASQHTEWPSRYREHAADLSQLRCLPCYFGSTSKLLAQIPALMVWRILLAKISSSNHIDYFATALSEAFAIPLPRGIVGNLLHLLYRKIKLRQQQSDCIPDGKGPQWTPLHRATVYFVVVSSLVLPLLGKPHPFQLSNRLYYQEKKR